MIVRAAVAALALLLAIGPGRAEDTSGSVSFYRVDHNSKYSTTLHDFMQRKMPYIAVYSVDPPLAGCGEGECWPTLHAFVSPAPFGGGQDIKVGCTAFSQDNQTLVTAADELSLKASETSSLHMNLKYPDFAAIDHVVCKIAEHSHNDL